MNLKIMKKKNLTISNGFEINIEQETLERKKFHDQSLISHIIDNIYISGNSAAKDINNLIGKGFTHVLNCAANNAKIVDSNLNHKLTYLNLEIKDDPSYNLLHQLLEAIGYLEEIHKFGGKVLIHCVEGISRSPSITLSYMIWKYGYDRETAYSIMKTKREFIDINFGFLIQLDNFANLLKTPKEFSIFRFDQNYNISVLNSSELENSFIEESTVLLFYKNSILYQFILEKNSPIVSKFIELLQKYLNYPKNVVIL